MEQDVVGKKRKWYKRKIFYIFLILFLLIGGVYYGQAKKKNEQPKYETVKVEKGKISQTVDATGNIESAGDVDLRFEAVGRIEKVYKQVNDKVKQGETIAQLDLGELNSRIGQASARVQEAQANLNKLLVGNTPEYIAGLEAQLNQAKAGLEQTKASADTSIHVAESALETAENNLKKLESGVNSQIIKDAYDDMYALLLTIQSSLSGELVKADSILGVDNVMANDTYEPVLSILNINKLNTAKTRYSSAKNIKNDVDGVINNLSSVLDEQKIEWATDQTEEALVIFKDLFFTLSEVLENTHPMGGLTQTQLDTLVDDVQGARAEIAANYTSLINSRQSIKSAKNSFSSYQIAYNKAVKDLADIKKKSEADIQSGQALVDKAEASLLDAKNPPREQDKASYLAAIKQAQASLGEAVAARKKALIIAPIDGVIGKIDGKVGEYVSSQNIVVKLISPHFEVKVDIPETDIVKISVGNSADIKLDAFGDDNIFKGTVLKIEKGETVIQDVVYYTVTLSLVDDKKFEILNGMTANVIFYTEEKDGVLVLPQRAIRSREKEKYVRILEGKNVIEKTIKIGLKGDEGNVEVIEGVNQDETVIVNSLK